MEINLKLLSDVTKSKFDYDDRIRTYECACGKGSIIWSKETPNGCGSGYQATYSDVFFYCEECEAKYDFVKDGSVTLKK